MVFGAGGAGHLAGLLVRKNTEERVPHSIVLRHDFEPVLAGHIEPVHPTGHTIRQRHFADRSIRQRDKQASIAAGGRSIRTITDASSSTTRGTGSISMMRGAQPTTHKRARPQSPFARRQSTGRPAALFTIEATKEDGQLPLVTVLPKRAAPGNPCVPLPTPWLRASSIGWWSSGFRSTHHSGGQTRPLRTGHRTNSPSLSGVVASRGR